MILEDQIAQIVNHLDFTRLVNAIFTCTYGEDFQPIDGTRGDQGNDGYIMSEKRILAIYCPLKPQQRTDAEYIEKIRCDIRKASALKINRPIERWTFVTPGKLTDKIINELNNLGKEYGFVDTNHISSTYLAEILSKHTYLLESFPFIKFPRQKLLKSYNEVMEVDAHNVDPLLDWPILLNIESGEKSEVSFDEEKLHEIDDKLTNPSNRRILLKGLGGSGKTVLSRLLAYRKRLDNWQVFFVDIREAGSDQISIEAVINDIKNDISGSKPRKLYIFENAHLYDETTSKFIKNADSIVNDYTNSHFIFCSRDLAKDDDLSPFDNWKKLGLLSLVCPDNKLAEDIVTRYIQANGLKYELTQSDRDWIKTTITLMDNSDGHGIGGDLRLLRLFLIAWKYNPNRNLCDLQDQDIIKSLKKFLLTDELSGSPALADLIGKISSIFQFDVPFYGKRADWSNSRDYLIDLKSLMEKGKIKFIGTDFYALIHSRDAYYITKCLADHQKQSHSDYTG